jgi:thioredoxin reductase
MSELSLESIYDCVIVGGGPAGLTCAIFLGRYRRRTLVIDAGKPRNYASYGIHGFLGYHAIPPHDLLTRGRGEAERVGVLFLDGSVSKVEKGAESFEVHGNFGKVRARRVVLAYGVRDELPDIPRFHEYYGKSAFHCPDCDGYESSGKKIGVIGYGKRVAGLALKLLQWSDDVTVFTDGKDPDLNEEHMSKLQAEGIKIHCAVVKEFVGNDGQITALRIDSNTEVPVESVFFTLGVKRGCVLAEDIGCEVMDPAPDIRVDEHKQTTVEGVYAIGDLVPGSQLAITAAADGAIAAIAINQSLLPPARRV